MFKVVIPARYASTRLPGKPLRIIAGRTMLEHVCRQVAGAGADEVLVATDDERIVAAAQGFGVRARLTAAHHLSGTDRLAEVARAEGWDEDRIVVNVQGDEPLLPAANVAQVARRLAADRGAQIATLMTPIERAGDFLDPNVVKVVAARGRALYFSRSPLPWHRGFAEGGPDSLDPWQGAQRHVGLYAYRVGSLCRLALLPPTPFERSERLEQLRALEHGLAIAIDVADVVPGPGVDTEEDLERVRALLEAPLSSEGHLS